MVKSNSEPHATGTMLQMYNIFHEMEPARKQSEVGEGIICGGSDNTEIFMSFIYKRSHV